MKLKIDALRTRYVVSLVDRDPRLDYGVVFPATTVVSKHPHPHHSPLPILQTTTNSHITHRHHIINLPNPQPMQHVRHQRLEPHVLHARNELRRLEVLVRGVASALTKVVHQVSVGA